MRRILGLGALLISAGWKGLLAGEVNPVLRFPKDSDRFMVLMAAAILIIGMILVVDRMRRGAEKRSKQT